LKSPPPPIATRATEADALVDAVNGSAPSGETRRLQSVELAARGLEQFSRDRPSISKEIKLVDWVSGKQTWPPRHAVNPNYYQSDGRKHAYDCSSEWWKAGAAEADGCDGCCRLRNRSLFRGPRT
jgi:hypothetical protein